LDIPPVKGIDPEKGREVERPADDDAPLSALIFKIVTDPYVGRLSYFRVYSGKIVQGLMAYNPTKYKKERIGRLLRMYADHREDVTEIRAGDIGAVLGLKEPSRVIPYVTSIIQSFWKISPSRSRSSR